MRSFAGYENFSSLVLFEVRMYASITFICIRMFHENEMMHSIERDSRLKCV